MGFAARASNPQSASRDNYGPSSLVTVDELVGTPGSARLKQARIGIRTIIPCKPPGILCKMASILADRPLALQASMQCKPGTGERLAA